MSAIRLDIKLKRQVFEGNSECPYCPHENIHIIAMRENHSVHVKRGVNDNPTNFKEWEYVVIADGELRVVVDADWNNMSHHYEVVSFADNSNSERACYNRIEREVKDNLITSLKR
jgi:hypothetical protein